MTDLPTEPPQATPESVPLKLDIAAELATKNPTSIHTAIHRHYKDLTPADYKKLADGYRMYAVVPEADKKQPVYKSLPNNAVDSRTRWRERYREKLAPLIVLGMLLFLAVFVTAYYVAKWKLEKG